MSETVEHGEAISAADRQKLIQELKDMKMYEVGMNVHEMKQFLKAVQESNDLALSNRQNRIQNEIPESPPPGQPCSSQAINTNSLSLQQRGSSSPELPPNKHSNLFSEEKHVDSLEDSMLLRSNRNSSAKDSKEGAININKTRHSTKELEIMNEKKCSNLRINSQLRNEEKTAKWKINPLDFERNEKDVPLRSRFCSSSDQDCDDFKMPVNIEKAIEQLSLHLQKVSDSFRGKHSVQSNFPWGTAIKVGMANGSLDKKTIDENETTTEIAEPPDETDHNDINELPSGRRRRACVKLGSRVYSEIDDNDSDDDSETQQKKIKATMPEEESNNPIQTDLNISSESSRRRKFPARDDDYDYGDQWTVDDNDTDDERKNVSKRKKARPSSAKKTTTSRSTRGKSVEPASNIESKVNALVKEDEEPICIDDPEEITIYDNEGTSYSLNKIKRCVSAEATSSTASTSYPRRIVPPIPKGKYSGIRIRKPLHPNASRVKKNEKRNNDANNEDNANDAEVARTISRGGGKFGLAEAEIAEALENNEVEAEEPLSSDSSNFVALRHSSRMRMQCQYLQAERQKDAKAELNRQQEEKLKDEALTLLRQERVSQRVREENEKLKAAELEEKRQLAFEDTWKLKIKAKEKQRQVERPELNPEGPRNAGDVPIVEVMVENHFAIDQTEVEVLGDKRRGQDSQSEQLPCPICNKKFSVSEIEAHAASCEEFDAASSTGGSRSNSPTIPMSSRFRKPPATELFKCDTCSNFTAKDGREFENHVKSCLARLKEVACGQGLIVQVPDSPIRGLRMNSQQTDSEINYKEQFMPKTRSKLNTGVKRKRF